MMNGMRVSFLNRFLRMTAVVLAAAFAFLLAGCGGSSASTSFTWFVDNIPANLDPQVATKAEDVIACENLYGGLVRRNASGELVPDLCERWEISSDGLTYTFYLKSGLTYTGTKGAATDYAITAEDFVYAFRRVFDPQTASPYAVEFSAIQNSAAVLDGTADPGTLGVSAIGELTLVFRLSERDDTFLSKLTLPGAMPCDEAFFESTRGTYGLSSTSTLSSGSFYIYNWTASGLFLHRSAASPLVNNLRLVQNTSNTDKSAAQLIADEKCSAALDDTAEATSLQSVEYSDTTWALLFNASEGSVFAVASLRQALAGIALQNLSVPSSGLFTEVTGLVPDGLTVDGIDYRDAAGDLLPTIPDAKALYMQARQGMASSDFNGVTILLPQGSGLTETVEQINGAWQKDCSLFFSVEEVPQEEFDARLASGKYTIALAPIRAEGGSVYQMLQQFAGDNNLTGLTDPLYAGTLSESIQRTGTARCLVSRYMHSFYMRKLFDGFQCDNHLNGCAIRVGNHTTWTIFSISCIYFGHYQGYIGIHTESAGVINHYRTIPGNSLLKLFRRACTGRSESNVHPFKVIVVLQKFDLDLFTAESIFSSGTTFRTEQN